MSSQTPKKYTLLHGDLGDPIWPPSSINKPDIVRRTSPKEKDFKGKTKALIAKLVNNKRAMMGFPIPKNCGVKAKELAKLAELGFLTVHRPDRLLMYELKPVTIGMAIHAGLIKENTCTATD